MTNQALLVEEEKRLLEELPEDILLSILEFKRLKDLEALLTDKFPEKDYPGKKAALIALAKKRSAHIKTSGNKISESLFELLTPMSYVFLIVDTMFTLITAITLVAFAIVSVGLAALVGLIGVVGFIGMYKELKHQEEKDNKKCELLAFQNDCAEIYIKKKLNNENEYLNRDVHKRTTDKKSDNKAWQKANAWMGTTILVTGALFYTYYAITLGLTIAFAGSLIVAGMAGPIGIGIALGVACAIGIYFGYKKYQANKRDKLLKKERKTLEDEFDINYKNCRVLNRMGKITTLEHNPMNNAGITKHANVITRSAPTPMTSGMGPVLFKRNDTPHGSSFSVSTQRHGNTYPDNNNAVAVLPDKASPSTEDKTTQTDEASDKDQLPKTGTSPRPGSSRNS